MEGVSSNTLKRRISSTYVSIYFGICIITILTVIAGYAIYEGGKFVSSTTELGERIMESYAAQERIEPSVYRYELYQMAVPFGASEVFLYDENNSLIVATNYAISNDEYFEADSKNVITRLFPKYVSLFDRIIIDEYDGEYNDALVRILIYYDVSESFGNFSFIMELLVATMLVGFAMFIVFGRAQTHIMLAPISEMTAVAKQINGDNLNLRIGEMNAQFELSELAETINSMMDRIQNSYEKQKRFVSDVSHELRTPISVISGYANMLSRWGKEDEEILTEGIDAIKHEADAMNELVATLLFLARHDNETLKFEPTLADVSQIVSEHAKETELVHSDFDISSDIESGIMAMVDESRFKQLCRIFTDNAIKYSLEKKTLRLRLYREGGNFVFSVADSGIGISAADLPNIFDRFYRADESRTKTSGGYGLGLSIARIIVSAHGGKIKVRSKLGEGSEFAVILPIRGK